MTPEAVLLGVALLIMAVAAFIYVIIMGPSRYHRDGAVGRIYLRLIDCPAVCCGCFCGVFFGCSYTRGRQKWTRCADHTLRERNWFMVAFYILLVWSVELLYLFVALPELQASVWSKIVSCGLVMLSEGTYGLAVFSDPGIVTSREEAEAQRSAFAAPARPTAHRRQLQGRESSTRRDAGENSAAPAASRPGSRRRGSRGREFLLSPEAEARQNRKYVLDGILYPMDGRSVARSTAGGLPSAPAAEAEAEAAATGLECTTCHVPRPSRSKHCRLCDFCVRRYDHHCPWINNDVAEGTHRWFLLFIVCHAVSCFWAAWDLYTIMKTFLIRNHAWGWSIRLHDGRRYPLRLEHYLVILATHQTIAVCLFMFAVLIGLLLWVFWLYQMSFVFTNLTLNDMGKIDDTVEFVASLPSLDAVYREALGVRRRLEVVAARPPRKLRQLAAPPPEVVPGSRGDKSYRKRVQKMLYGDLKGIFDRGLWGNVMEVLFPYSPARGAAAARPSDDAPFAERCGSDTRKREPKHEKKETATRRCGRGATASRK
ncbi:putative Zinc finger DHHC domain containing transmembrane protein [Trypanosoma conorhini]|uniref:Palmitoyltransferase n=1 Tax=Trypanosoma conorhini TaxID=83891 RepID=A0A3R7S3A4_9TRYP|nr:putative Zinc finger DHHC domain containing transmembrane protein [Trypanosoma conorhini]RNF20348.1 putative Zinc finger DHHC domain containing transmembrane protein [Trypanosoma conorhini]